MTQIMLNHGTALAMYNLLPGQSTTVEFLDVDGNPYEVQVLCKIQEPDLEPIDALDAQVRQWILSQEKAKSDIILYWLNNNWSYEDVVTAEELSPLDNCKTLDKAYSRMHDLFVAELGMTPTEYHHFYAWVQDHLGSERHVPLGSKMRLVFGNLGNLELDDDFCTISLSDVMGHGTEQSLAVCLTGETRVDWRHVQNPKWSTIVSNALAYAIKHHGYNQNK